MSEDDHVPADARLANVVASVDKALKVIAESKSSLKSVTMTEKVNEV